MPIVGMRTETYQIPTRYSFPSKCNIFSFQMHLSFSTAGWKNFYGTQFFRIDYSIEIYSDSESQSQRGKIKHLVVQSERAPNK